MAAISVRNLDDQVKERLRVRAARHGRSLESEVRDILARAAEEPDAPTDLVSALVDTFSALGGVELDLPPRSDAPRAPTFR